MMPVLLDKLPLSNYNINYSQINIVISRQIALKSTKKVSRSIVR